MEFRRVLFRSRFSFTFLARDFLSKKSVVKQRLRALPTNFLKRTPPRANDRARRPSALERFKGLGVRQQPDEVVDLPGRRVKVTQGGGNLNADGNRLKPSSIRHDNVDAATLFVFVNGALGRK